MRTKAVMAALGYLLLLFSFMFLVPIFTAVYYGEPAVHTYGAFVLPMLLSACMGGVMWYHTRQKAEDLRERDAFVVVGLAWLILALFGSLPYLLGGHAGFLDSYFESMSGFTTTGATVLTVQPGLDFLDVYPHSLLIWRSLTAWLGGMGIIVFSVVILAKYLEGSISLFKAEVSGASVTRIRPKLATTARMLWGIYALLTFLAFIMLMGAGMDVFDAVNHSLSVLATGGFSTHAGNVGYYNSWAVETVMMLFMIIGGVNFVLHYRLMSGHLKEVLKDTEFRFYILVLAVFSGLAVLALLFSGSQATLGLDIRDGMFQVVSATTTGGFFTTENLNSWPPFVHFIIILGMLFGASIGSTGGGLKVSRLLLLIKNARRSIFKAIHPRAVMPIKVGGRTVKERVMDRVQMMFFTYLVVLALATLILTATGLSVLESVSSVAGSLGNAGLGIFQPGTGFNNISGLAKMVLVFCMWMGRLEIFTALVVLAPSTYKR